MQFLSIHSHGENCVFFKNPELMQWIDPGILNLPALILSTLSSKAVLSVFPNYCAFTHAEMQLIITVIFITFQWLFIGWLAKTIAQKLTKNNY
jgi:hypothetical protein